MNTFLINLPRRTDRLQAALAQFANTKITPIVFPAIDGLKMPLPASWTVGPGAYGCSLSHRKVLEEVMNQGEEAVNAGVMIFEDDVELVKDFDAKLEHFLKTVPSDYDCLFLGGQHLEAPYYTHVPGVLRCQSCHRTHATIYRGKYLRFIYERWTAESGHIDHINGRNQKDWNVYAAYPWLALQGEGKSDINGRVLRVREWSPKRILPALDADKAPVQPPKDRVVRKACVPCKKKRDRNVRPSANNVEKPE